MDGTVVGAAQVQAQGAGAARAGAGAASTARECGYGTSACTCSCSGGGGLAYTEVTPSLPLVCSAVSTFKFTKFKGSPIINVFTVLDPKLFEPILKKISNFCRPVVVARSSPHPRLSSVDVGASNHFSRGFQTRMSRWLNPHRIRGDIGKRFGQQPSLNEVNDD